MSRPPNHTEEEIREEARRLHAVGKLTVDALLEVVGGGRDRVARIVREVLQETPRFGQWEPDPSLTEVAQALTSAWLAAEDAIRRVRLEGDVSAGRGLRDATRENLRAKGLEAELENLQEEVLRERTRADAASAALESAEAMLVAGRKEAGARELELARVRLEVEALRVTVDDLERRLEHRGRDRDPRAKPKVPAHRPRRHRENRRGKRRK